MNNLGQPLVYSIAPSNPTEGQGMHEVVSSFIDVNFHKQRMKTREDVTTLLILVGDRIFCCDEVVTATDATTQEVIGLCTMSSKGEQQNGQAGIVATVVKGDRQKQGIGRELLIRAIDRLQERMTVNETRGPIHIDCVSRAGVKLVRRLLQERPDYEDALEIRDLSSFLDVLDAEQSAPKGGE